MAEEQRWQEAGTHTLCANNCGFFGSTTTLNLCSKCYKDYCIRDQQIKDACLAMETTLCKSGSSIRPAASSAPASFVLKEEPAESSAPTILPAAEESSAPARPNRCGACKKRVGLTGFSCRCGVTFCGSHRYPEKHGCGFDYKAVGREEIAKANPMVKAQKLHKI